STQYVDLRTRKNRRPPGSAQGPFRHSPFGGLNRSSDRAFLVRINQFSSTLTAMSSPPSVPERIEEFRWRSNGSDGVVSLTALRWLSDQKASFVMLERDGSVLTTTGPVHSSDARLRRAQALAHGSGAALRITRELIRQKLAGQALIARNKLWDTTTAGTIAKFSAELPMAENIASIRLIEAQSASAYWSAW